MTIRSQRGADVATKNPLAGEAWGRLGDRYELGSGSTLTTERATWGTTPSRGARISHLPGDDSTPLVELHG